MNLVGWHLIDIFFILLGCYFVIRGCFRGFVGEVITLVGFFCSIYVSFKFSGKFGDVISAFTGIKESVSQLVAIILVWLVISIIVAAIRKIMKGFLSAISLSGIDRLLGIFSGLLKTFVAVYVVLIGGLLLAPVVEPTWMTKSDIIRYAGRQWPEVKLILIDFNLLPNAETLPEGTLEQILRPYRTGESGPEGYMPNSDRTLKGTSIREQG
ncbi:MAG: CvpA family protein [Synergistaceae bacterium]|nr:CvpA family protein [Synergistaceae bacterium]